MRRSCNFPCNQVNLLRLKIRNNILCPKQVHIGRRARTSDVNVPGDIISCGGSVGRGTVRVFSRVRAVRIRNPDVPLRRSDCLKIFRRVRASEKVQTLPVTQLIRRAAITVRVLREKAAASVVRDRGERSCRRFTFSAGNEGTD